MSIPQSPGDITVRQISALTKRVNEMAKEILPNCFCPLACVELFDDGSGCVGFDYRNVHYYVQEFGVETIAKVMNGDFDNRIRQVIEGIPRLPRTVESPVKTVYAFYHVAIDISGSYPMPDDDSSDAALIEEFED